MKNLIIFLITILIINCGGSTGSTTSSGNDGGTTTPSIENAASYLSDGDIENAKSQYDSLLEDDATNSQAAFGAALTRLALLSENSTTQSALSDLGQMQFAISNFLGDSGYLANLNSINAASVELDGYTSPFYGTTTHSTLNYSNRSQSTVTMHFNDSNNDIDLKISIIYSANCVNSDTGYTFSNGDSIDVSDSVQDLTDCNNYVTPISITVRTSKNDGYNTYYTIHSTSSTTPSSGSVQFDTVNSSNGEIFAITLNNVVLYNNSDSITLNGTVSDTIHDATKTNGSPENYLPFAHLDAYSLGYLLSEADDTLTLSDLQTYSQQYIPLYQEIQTLLETADQSDDFSFTIPKESFYANKDITFNRIDLKTIRAGIDFTLMTLYMADSWECSMVIGNIFPKDFSVGDDWLRSRAEVVEDLNTCFNLKSDHQLTEAKAEFEKGLTNLLDAYDVMATVTQDGILEETSLTADGYAELDEMREVVRDSLTSDQNFDYVVPSITLNLGNFFANPPSANELSTDPFVVENDKIKLVEVAVEEFFQDVMNLDLTQKYKSNFLSVNREFMENVLDEIQPLIIAGRIYDVREGKKW